MPFNFADKNWLFPSTVEAAVQNHQLDYIPPGYYYKMDRKGFELILEYHFQPGDFYNETQPKEYLYGRSLHSYVFRFKDKPGVYDSLKNNLEGLYNKKFVLTKGMKDGSTLREDEKPFENHFLTIDSCLTVGIAKGPMNKNKERFIVVRYMYNLSVGKMGVRMSNLLN